MKNTKFRYFVGDFETTVYEGQTSTEVWASAVVELYSENVIILHSIADTFSYLKSIKENICVYYHNLKFDGNFWLSYLLNVLHFEQAYSKEDGFLQDSEMPNNTFSYCISEMGQWYYVKIKVGGKIIELRDSLKLLPFSVAKIGKSFGTKHKKLDMEYEGFRYAGCEITDKEKEYIANDVLVVKEAIEIMYNEGHTELTIGSCCLKEFKRIMGSEFDTLFPDLYECDIDPSIYGVSTAGDYVRKSYHGGWCYAVPHRTNKLVKHKGVTADVNSLYPSMMSSESGNHYPVGMPHFWSGNFIPPVAKNTYYFVRVRTRFYLKDNMLPCIQIKHNPLYCATEWLTSSDVGTGETKRAYYIDSETGEVRTATVELTLTMTDWELIKEHYWLPDCEILDGCWFYNEIGIFDLYIDKYKKIKMVSKGAIRELAKLFLNNLYGKMAASQNSSYQVAYVTAEGAVKFTNVVEFKKKAGYIPVGSAITSYARNFTIRAAQMNYYGEGKRGFIYADTDSIHCDLLPEEVKGITVHPTNFCCWKLEGTWDKAIFVRQKTYIEHIVQEDLQDCEPHYEVRCAGMPQRCKDLFLASMGGTIEGKLTAEEQEFLKEKHTLEDFKIGLKLPSKLLPKKIQGGVVLMETTYEMR